MLPIECLPNINKFILKKNDERGSFIYGFIKKLTNLIWLEIGYSENKIFEEEKQSLNEFFYFFVETIKKTNKFESSLIKSIER